MNSIVIGAGISGMVASCYLAKAGFDVHVYEKNAHPGGRARQFSENGFTFDMGPSWYWMPDVFERFFNDFGKSTADYYELIRLSPSYRVYFKEQTVTIPSGVDDLYELFESLEVGSGNKLKSYLEDAEYKYRLGMGRFAQKPSLQLSEFLDKDLFAAIARLQMFSNMRDHVNSHFSSPVLQKIMQFPVIFLGAMPERIPAMYSLMNYADTVLGTWYPKGGMYMIVEAIYKLASELGVNFHFNTDIKEITCEKGKVSGVFDGENQVVSDVLINSGDYHHIESLLPKAFQSYSEHYWSKRKMAPSSLIYYLGLNKKLPIGHHSLFFDADYDKHANELYKSPSWPEDPMFYVCAPSVTDDTVAPIGHENLFVLIPIAAGLEPSDEGQENHYLDLVIGRMEKQLGQSIREHIVYKRVYSIQNFKEDYHAFKGNAYGLANTLRQTAIFKPSIRSKKIKNLFYCGQLTSPGPGVPPAFISGKIAAQQAIKYHIK